MISTHYLIYTTIAWSLAYIFVGRRFLILWKASLLGVALTVLVDYFGTKYNFYVYPRGGIYLGNLPLFHLINSFAIMILFFNWLPRRWGRRLPYTIYASVIFLFLEAVMYSAGAISYPNWKLWYSYFLILGGLSLAVFLADLLGWLPKPENVQAQ